MNYTQQAPWQPSRPNAPRTTFLSSATDLLTSISLLKDSFHTLAPHAQTYLDLQHQKIAALVKQFERNLIQGCEQGGDLESVIEQQKQEIGIVERDVDALAKIEVELREIVVPKVIPVISMQNPEQHNLGSMQKEQCYEVVANEEPMVTKKKLASHQHIVRKEALQTKGKGEMREIMITTEESKVNFPEALAKREYDVIIGITENNVVAFYNQEKNNTDLFDMKVGQNGRVSLSLFKTFAKRLTVLAGRRSKLICDNYVFTKQSSHCTYADIETEWVLYDTLTSKDMLCAAFVTESDHIVHGLDNHSKITSYEHKGPMSTVKYKKMQKFATSIKSQSRYQMIKRVEESKHDNKFFIAQIVKDLVRVEFDKINSIDKTDSEIIFRGDQATHVLIEFCQLPDTRQIATLTEYQLVIFDQFTKEQLLIFRNFPQQQVMLMMHPRFSLDQVPVMVVQNDELHQNGGLSIEDIKGSGAFGEIMLVGGKVRPISVLSDSNKFKQDVEAVLRVFCKYEERNEFCILQLNFL